MTQPTKFSPKRKLNIKTSWLRPVVFFLIFTLLALVLIIPASLRLMYRADAGVALGNAKSVRLALQVTGKECYGKDQTFSDASGQGGVTENVYRDVINLSKAPGEFWVLKLGRDGYTVDEFIYKEDEFTVWYQASPKTYTVYHDETMIAAE